MIEQLNLFAEPYEPPKPIIRNPYENTWWKPKDFYRYNENGRESGWVRVDHRYVAWVTEDELKHKLSAGYYRTDEKRYSHWGWISGEDLEQHFDRITKPEWIDDD